MVHEILISTFNVYVGHMDFLERKYAGSAAIRLRMKDMVRVSPLEEDPMDRPESLQNYYDERY